MADGSELTEAKRDRLDVEWMTTSALRDGMVTAHGKPEEVTYKQAFALGRQVAPEMYKSVDRILNNPRESIGAQEIRQRAHAQSILDGETITPVEYIESEIVKLRTQINAIDEGDDRNHLENTLTRYENIRQEIQSREYRETPLIFGDAVKTGRGLPTSGQGQGYTDYQLNKDRMLRVRVTHMERPEDRIGCDLIYENLNDKKKTARIVIIQYKMWERYDQVKHLSPRDEKQYAKLTGATCKGRLCDPEAIPHRAYRLPTCTAFVRPTDRLQQPNSITTSSSLHIPICVLNESWQTNQAGGKSVRRDQINGRSLSHRTFGELFDYCMVGSKEITFDQMTTMYHSFGILENQDKVVVHFQDVKD
jgi:hypothetical protein